MHGPLSPQPALNTSGWHPSRCLGLWLADHMHVPGRFAVGVNGMGRLGIEHWTDVSGEHGSLSQVVGGRSSVDHEPTDSSVHGPVERHSQRSRGLSCHCPEKEVCRSHRNPHWRNYIKQPGTFPSIKFTTKMPSGTYCYYRFVQQTHDPPKEPSGTESREGRVAPGHPFGHQVLPIRRAITTVQFPH